MSAGMAEPPYNPDCFKCPAPKCIFSVTPPKKVDPGAARQCALQLFAHLEEEGSTCLAAAGYSNIEAYKKVSHYTV